MSLFDDMKINGRVVDIAFKDACTGLRVMRSMSQTHTVEFNVCDSEGDLLESDLWKQRSNLSVGADNYVLARWEKQGYVDHYFVFEDLTAYVMRNTKKIKRAFRDKVNRVQFVASLCREAGVPFFSPEAPPPSPTFQPNVRSSGQASGFDPAFHPTIKGSKATTAQLDTMSDVLSAAFTAPVNAPERAVVALVMAVTQESSFNNRAQVRSHNGFQQGILQQAATTGWHGLFDPVLSVQEFMLGKLTSAPTQAKRTFTGQGFLAYYKTHLSEGTTAEGLAAQIDRIQASGNEPGTIPWYAEAQRTVGAYQRTTPHRGLLLNDKFAFTVGRPGAKEDYWSAAIRIAQEIGWYVFTINGTVWMVSPEWLFTAPAKATLTEGEGAIGQITWQLDSNSPLDTMSVEVDDGWAVHPGVTVKVEGQGPASGKWLLAEWERDAFRPSGTLTLAKPGATIPEPVGDQTGKGWKPPSRGTDPSAAPTTPSGSQYQVGTATVQPIPQVPGLKLDSKGHRVQGQHITDGLPGYEAIDFGGAGGANIAGAPVVAVENGVIVTTKIGSVGHDPRGVPPGPIGGPGVFGWNIYLQGDSGTTYFYTHLAKPSPPSDTRVRGGQVISTVADWHSHGRADHVHLGVHPGANGTPNITTIDDSPRAVPSGVDTATSTAGQSLGQRARIAAAAQLAVANADAIDYTDFIDLSPMLTLAKVIRERKPGLDCTSIIELVYKAAGAPDPCGHGYTGRDVDENTADLLAHCTHIAQSAAVAGDLVVFGSTETNTVAKGGVTGLGHHAVILMEDGPTNSSNPFVFTHGQDSDPSIVRYSIVAAAQSSHPGIQFLRVPGLVS